MAFIFPKSRDWEGGGSGVSSQVFVRTAKWKMENRLNKHQINFHNAGFMTHSLACLLSERVWCHGLHPVSGVLMHLFVCSSSNNTLWGSLKEPDIVSANEFEDLFSKAALQQKKKTLSDTYEKKAKTKQVLGRPSSLLCACVFSSFAMRCCYRDVCKARLVKVKKK